MRIVIQRTSRSAVGIGGRIHASIGSGLTVLVGVENGDTTDHAHWLAAKTAALRIMPDAQGVMNLSVAQTGGDILAISQFTLTASTRRGNRPSYIRAAHGPEAEALYMAYCYELERILGRQVQRGVFGADMDVELINDGPVTIIIDSRQRE